MLMRDALTLLSDALAELHAHESDYHHETKKGLKEEIKQFIDSVKPIKKDRS